MDEDQCTREEEKILEWLDWTDEVDFGLGTEAIGVDVPLLESDDDARRMTLQSAIAAIRRTPSPGDDHCAAFTLLRTQAIWFGIEELRDVGLSQFRQLAMFMNPYATGSGLLLFALAERHRGCLRAITLRGVDAAPEALERIRYVKAPTGIDYLRAVDLLMKGRRWRNRCVELNWRQIHREGPRAICHELTSRALDYLGLGFGFWCDFTLLGKEDKTLARPIGLQRRRIESSLARVLIRFQRSLKPLPGPQVPNPWLSFRSRNWALRPSTPLARERRCQALAALPCFTKLLTTNAELACVVDNCRPLVPAIARTLTVPKKHVVRLAAYSVSHTATLQYVDWRSFLNIAGRRVSTLPLPATEQDWAVFRMLERGLGSWTPDDPHAELHELGLDSDWLLRFKARSWEALAEEICFAADAPDLGDAFHRLREAVALAGPLLRRVTSDYFRPYLPNTPGALNSPGGRLRALFTAKHPRAILRFATDFWREAHKDDWRCNLSAGWRSLLVVPGARYFAGFAITELETASAFETVGSALRNCLGSYPDECASKCLRVFSVADETGCLVAAFSVSWSLARGRVRFRLTEIKGAENTPPHPLVITAANLFMQSLEIKETRSQAKAISEAVSMTGVSLPAQSLSEARDSFVRCLVKNLGGPDNGPVRKLALHLQSLDLG